MKRLCLFVLALLVLLSSPLSLNALAEAVTGYANNGTHLTGIHSDAGSITLTEEDTAINISATDIDAAEKMVVTMADTPIDGGEIELSYKIKIVDTNSEVIRIPIITSDGEPVIEPMWHNGNFATNNGTDMMFKLMAVNTWHTVRFVIDTNACTFDFYLNSSPTKTVSGKFYKANILSVDGIRATLISGQSIRVKDISLKRTGEGGARVYLFNSTYSVSHSSKIIGNMPAYMKKETFLSSIHLAEEVTAGLSTTGAWIENGDTLELTDNRTGNKQTYTMIVRTPAISIGLAGVFKNALLLKEGESFYYCNGQAYTGTALQKGVLSQEAASKLGIQVQSPVMLNALQGCTVTHIPKGYVIIQKNPPLAIRNSGILKYDMRRLFGEVVQ